MNMIGRNDAIKRVVGAVGLCSCSGGVLRIIVNQELNTMRRIGKTRRDLDLSERPPLASAFVPFWPLAHLRVRVSLRVC